MRLPLLESEPLAIYLTDHLAGSTAGFELARRLAANNRSNDYGPELAAIAQELGEDRQTLIDLMRRLGIEPDRLKNAVLWGAEKLGRVKFNGNPLRYSPLSRLEEIEMLLLGVHGKLAAWRALRDTRAHDERLRGIDLEALIARADSQRERLDHQRVSAAREAFASP